MSQTDTTVVTIDNPIGVPIFKSRLVNIQKNDTIFVLEIFPSSGEIDSILYTKQFYIKYNFRKWISYRTDNSFIIKKFRRVNKTSKWFIENNGIYFNAEFEVFCTSLRVYNQEKQLTYKWARWTIIKNI
jgi:hypothetical protein